MFLFCPIMKCYWVFLLTILILCQSWRVAKSLKSEFIISLVFFSKFLHINHLPCFKSGFTKQTKIRSPIQKTLHFAGKVGTFSPKVLNSFHIGVNVFSEWADLLRICPWGAVRGIYLISTAGRSPLKGWWDQAGGKLNVGSQVFHLEVALGEKKTSQVNVCICFWAHLASISSTRTQPYRSHWVGLKTGRPCTVF